MKGKLLSLPTKLSIKPSSSFVTVFISSLLLLSFEFCALRILAYSHWMHFVYFILTLSFLGFAIGGAIAALPGFWERWELKEINACLLVAFALTALIAIGYGSSQVGDINGLSAQLKAGNWGPFLKIYLPLFLILLCPFSFLSFLICRSLQMSGAGIGYTYAANLMGTALGSIGFLMLFGPLGAYRFFFLILFTALGLALAQFPKSRVIRGLIFIGLALCVAGGIFPELIIHSQVDQAKNLATVPKTHFLSHGWTPLGRTDLTKTHFGYRLTTDGDAQTFIFPLRINELKLGPFFVPVPSEIGRTGVFNLVSPLKRNRALVLGAGGGMEVAGALQSGFKQIDAVEIDPIRVSYLKGSFSALFGDLFQNERVNLQVGEGRRFVSQAEAKYDAVILYNVDTLTAASTGAYHLVENYLYTVEALESDIRILNPEGIFQVTRPNWGGAAELERMFASLLLIAGKLHLVPAEHLCVIGTDQQVDFYFSKAVLHPQTIEQWFNELYVKRGGGKPRILFGGMSGEGELHRRFLSLASAANEGRLSAVLEESDRDIRPVTDDRPFFFETERWDRGSSLINGMGSQFNNWSGTILRLSLVLSVLSLISLIFIILHKTPKLRHSSSSVCLIGYFVCIGLGYTLLQTTFIQRFSLLLGHPLRSMAVVIPSLLLGMGVGSLSCAKLLRSIKAVHLVTRIALVGPLLMGTLIESGFQSRVLETLTYQPDLVLGISVLTMFVMGTILGFSFPLGCHFFSGSEEGRMPLIWSVNGGASVIGSSLAVMLSLTWGFHSTSLCAIFAYAVASVFLCVQVRTPKTQLSTGFQAQTSLSAWGP